MRDDIPDHVAERMKEVKKIYDISEAEEQCLIQMSVMIKMLGFSLQLSTKLLKALAALHEVLLDEITEKGKK